MTQDQILLKESIDLLRETVEELIKGPLDIAKRFALLEERVKKQLGQPSDKPSLFTKEGNAAPLVEDKKPEAEKPVVTKPPEFPDPPTEAITDPVKKISKSFDGPFPPGDPRSTTPQQKKEMTDPANHTGDLPWETGIEQEGVKTKEPVITSTRRPQPEKQGEDPFANVP